MTARNEMNELTGEWQEALERVENWFYATTGSADEDMSVVLRLANEAAALRRLSQQPSAGVVQDNMVSWPDPHSGDRIVGFRIRKGDPRIADHYGLNWLRSIATPRPAAAVSEAMAVLEREVIGWLDSVDDANSRNVAKTHIRKLFRAALSPTAPEDV